MINTSQQMGADEQELGSQNQPKQRQSSSLEKNIKKTYQKLSNSALGFVKKFEFKLTKKKLLLFIVLIATLITIYFGLSLIAQIKPEPPPAPKTSKLEVELPKPLEISAERKVLEESVNDFNEKVNILSNYEEDFSPPQLDLDISFE